MMQADASTSNDDAASNNHFLALFSSLPDLLLCSIFKRVPLRQFFSLAFVSRRFRFLQRTVIVQHSFTVLCEVSVTALQGSQHLSCNRVTVTRSDQSENAVPVKQIADFHRAPVVDQVFNIIIVNNICGQEPDSIPLQHYLETCQESYYVFRRCRNLRQLQFINPEPRLFVLPYGRLVIPLLFPKLETVVWATSRNGFYVLIKVDVLRNFITDLSVHVFDSDNVCWTSSSALDHLQEIVQVLQADRCINLGNCSVALASRVVEFLGNFHGALRNFVSLNCKAVDLFPLITELRVRIGEVQQLKNTLRYLTHLQKLVLEKYENATVTSVLCLPLLPSLSTLVLSLERCRLVRNILFSTPNLQSLEMYSETMGRHLLYQIAEASHVMANLNRLKLVLMDRNRFLRPPNVDCALLKIGQNVKNLRTLVLGLGVTPSMEGLCKFFAEANELRHFRNRIFQAEAGCWNRNGCRLNSSFPGSEASTTRLPNIGTFLNHLMTTVSSSTQSKLVTLAFHLLFMSGEKLVNSLKTILANNGHYALNIRLLLPPKMNENFRKSTEFQDLGKVPNVLISNTLETSDHLSVWIKWSSKGSSEQPLQNHWIKLTAPVTSRHSKTTLYN